MLISMHNFILANSDHDRLVRNTIFLLPKAYRQNDNFSIVLGMPARGYGCASDNASLLGLGMGSSSHSRSLSSPFHPQAVQRKYHVTIGKWTTNSKTN
jgi:hypothetical protein